MGKVKVLGIKIDKYNYEEVLEKIEGFVISKKPHQIITANAEIVYRGHKDSELKKLINEADIVTPDGIGVVKAAQLLEDPVAEKVAGVELSEKICKLSGEKKWNIYFLGGGPGVAETARVKLFKKYPEVKIVGTHDGYFNEEAEKEIIKDIKSKQTDILFVALGFPKQEIWVKKNMKLLDVPVSIGVGGSFDVFSGNKKRAPKLVQKLGIESIYRLLQEPKRFKRYLDLPRFVIAVLKEKAQKQ